jgi:hypothetical protein
VKALFALGCALWISHAASAATELRWTSGTRPVSLLELYTSEGCSSCPPAEAWLDRLREDPGLWRDFIPVAFHVNYWDNLGWPDRFASRVFTQRQYAHAAGWNSGSVYTPCFVRDGAEWHPDADQPRRSPGRPGVLTLILLDPHTCRVEFTPPVDEGVRPGAWEAHVILLGGGFSSRVTAGENRGRMLTHEFVALQLVDTPLAAAAGAPTASAELPVPKANPDDAKGAVRLALAAWVTRSGELRPVQATGGWLPVRS